MLKTVAVDDCGVRINTMIVEGQIMGGLTEAYAMASMQFMTFDAEGNCIGSNFMDYLLPTAMEIPNIEVHHLETISPGGENDFRGVGENNIISTPAAITNAIEDALSPFGARVDTQYNPPSRILELAGIIPRA